MTVEATYVIWEGINYPGWISKLLSLCQFSQKCSTLRIMKSQVSQWFGDPKDQYYESNLSVLEGPMILRARFFFHGLDMDDCWKFNGHPHGCNQWLPGWFAGCLVKLNHLLRGIYMLYKNINLRHQIIKCNHNSGQIIIFHQPSLSLKFLATF